MADTTNAMPCNALPPVGGTGSTWQPVCRGLQGWMAMDPPATHLGKWRRKERSCPLHTLPTLPQGLRLMAPWHTPTPGRCTADNRELTHGHRMLARGTPLRDSLGRKHERSPELWLGRPWAGPRGAVRGCSAPDIGAVLVCAQDSIIPSSYMLRVCALFRVSFNKKLLNTLFSWHCVSHSHGKTALQLMELILKAT